MQSFIKYLVAFAVVLLVIVIPFGSWYYLQTGLNYRKEAIEKLRPKEHISELIIDSVTFNGNTTLLVNTVGMAESDKSNILKIVRQYQESPTFRYIEIVNAAEVDTTSKIPDVWLTSSKLRDENEIVLIDTSGYIRRYYQVDTIDLRDCIEHIAMILPRPERKKIKMKNGKDIDAKPTFMKK